MLNNAKIMAFIQSAKPQEARVFYEGQLGLRLVHDTPFALVFDAGGTSLRIVKVADVSRIEGTVLGWLVSDIAATVTQLGQAGVLFERFETMSQDDHGVCTFPNGDRVAWFLDPDGNMLSLTEVPA
jgi:catechol 2,3-dioxygenase-like lactoylglutathione lyase family enzyme